MGRALYDSTTGHRDYPVPRICIGRVPRARSAAGSEEKDCLETDLGRLDRCAEASRPNEASMDIRRALTSRQTTSASQGAIDKAQLIRRNLGRHFVQFDRKTLVRIGFPIGRLVRHVGTGSLKYDVETFTAHSSKGAVRVHQIQGIERSVHYLVW